MEWGEPADDRLDVIAGRSKALAGKTHETYGITMDKAELQIKRFERCG